MYNPHMRILAVLTLLAATGFAQTNAELKEQVRRAETAFAKTMADRDHAAFTKFLADEAIFMANGQPARGAKAVAERWKRFLTAKNRPFPGSLSSSKCSIPARWRPRPARPRPLRQARRDFQFGVAEGEGRGVEDRDGRRVSAVSGV